MSAELKAAVRIARTSGASALDEPAGKKLLASYGIRVPASHVAKSAAEIPSALSTLKPPYVLKVVSPEVSLRSSVHLRKSKRHLTRKASANEVG